MICTGKGNSGKNQDTVTLVSCEYAHWTLVAQVRPAPDYGGSTLWEIHRCYHILKLSGYLIWIISSIKLGSSSSWQKTVFHQIGSNVNGNFVWSRPCLINFLTSCLILSHRSISFLVYTSIHVLHLVKSFPCNCIHEGGKGLCQDEIHRYLSLIVKHLFLTSGHSKRTHWTWRSQKCWLG